MNTNHDQGFIALITAILISALLLGITLAQSRAAFYYRAQLLESEQKAQSRALAESCVHEAILRLTLDNSYAGNEEIQIAQQRCTIRPIEPTPNGLIIKTDSSVENASTDLTVEVTSTDFAIISWQEVFP